MSKAILGGIELGAAVGMGALAFFDPAVLATGAYEKIMAGLVVSGISMEAGAIASALTANRGMGVTTRQPAANRQLIYGEQRVGGVQIYQSTTGSEKDQYNFVIVLAGHPCNSIVNLYLDGRQVFWDTSSLGNQTVNGVNFGGNADGTTRVGPDGSHYNFGGLVYCEARYGTQATNDYITGLTANDPNWAPTAAGIPSVAGCTYVYLKVEYDSTMFPQVPEIRFTVQGKNTIYDPRTDTTGYSQNWALIVADVLCDPEFGFGFDMNTDINQAQLIAAANICDEQVTLAAGGTESRYTCNGHTDTATEPGDLLSSIMPAAGGRLSYVAGEIYIWPAAWQGVSYSFDQTYLLATPSFKQKSFREMCNTVRGTYIAPVYPYAVAGNLYDQNGFFEGQIQNNYGYAWQPTDYPEFQEDSAHGYATNQWLVQDGGNPLVTNVSYNYVISAATAQRLAKIYLRRSRQRITTTLHMTLAAYQLQPNDVMQLTYPTLGWTNKIFEVTGMRLITANQDGSSDDPPYTYVEVDVQETDPTIYDWTPATDELSPSTDLPFGAVQVNSAAPGAPTNAVLTDSAATAVVGADGVTRPRISVSWTAPIGGNPTQVQVQYQVVGGSWMDAATVDVGNTAAYIDSVVAGQTYNVQLRSIKSRTGAVSTWTAAGTHTVSPVYSQITSLGLAPGVLPNFADGVIPAKQSATVYTLPQAPNPASSLQLFQESSGGATMMTSGFSLSGSTITLSAALAAGVTLLCNYRY
jgi:hypothetical protein